jgi:hypothetical protein
MFHRIITAGSVPNAIPPVVGGVQGLTIVDKMTAYRVIQEMLRITTIPVNARTAIIRVSDGRMPALIMQDLVIAYPAIPMMPLHPITQVNVPTAMIRTVDGIIRVLITVD